MRSPLPVLFVAVLFAAVLFAAPLPTTLQAGESDWTEFLGSAFNVADESDLPTEWSESENIKWKAELPGPGSSSPMILGDRIFLTCWTGYGTEDSGEAGIENLVRHLICLDRGTGEEKWRASVPARMPEDDYNGFLREHGYATNTPATDGERVFVFHGKSGVFAYTLDGEQVWTADVGQESTQRQWGSAASPVVAERDGRPVLLVNAAEESAAVYCFDCQTGEEVWKAEAAGLTQSYATPRLVEIGGQTQIVLAVPGELWGLSLETGKLKWWAEIPVPGNVSPTPSIADGVAYVLGGRPNGGAAVRLEVDGEQKGDITDRAVIWETREASYVPSPVVRDGKLFVVSDKGIAKCLDAASGEVISQERVASGGGFMGMAVYATQLLAGDRLYVTSRTGGTYVLKADESLETLAHNEIAGDRSQFNASPVAAGGVLYLRSDAALYAIGE